MRTSTSVLKLTAKRFIGLFIALMILLGTVNQLPVKADTEATWSVGNSTYSSFSAALSAAGSSGTVKLASDGTLSAGTYTIPSGVKVVIPYNAATNTTPGNAPSGVGNSYTAPTPFRTLTMASGANIIVSSNAKLLVDGHFSAQGQGNGYNGTTTGPYGKVIMSSNSSITIQSGGELDAYGYITGPNNASGFDSGTVTALSGATIREYMQIKDFRGGTATSNMLNNSQRVFPFSQYYIQNVEVPLTLYAGAYDYVYSGIYVTFFGLQTTGAVQLFGPSGMFTIKSGYMQKTYLSAQDRLYVTVNGDVELNTIKFKMYLTVDTSKYVMPINNNMTLELASGTTTINRDSSLLAGVKVIIDKDATLKISSGKNVYLYDRDTWYADNYVISNHYWPLNYVAARNGAPVSRTISTGEIDNNGLIDIQGSMFSTSEKTMVTSSEKTGRVKFTAAAPADGTTYQAVQTGSDISYSSISVTSLLLTNGDNSSTVTKGSAAGTEYFYCGLHDKWEKTPSHILTFDPNGGSGSAYSLPVCQNEGKLPINEFAREGYSFDGWNTKADGSGTAYADKGNITVTADTTLYAQWKRHTHTYEVVKWNWNGYTSASVDVRCTVDSSHTDTLAASVTEDLVSSPTCTADGQKKYTATATYGVQTFTDIKTETLPAIGHNWQFVNFTWNGYSSAVGNYVCQNDQSHTQQITATITKTTPVEPGCETAGYNEYAALIKTADSPDGSEHRDTVREDLSELGHDWGQWQITKQATCLETGLRTRYCQRCSEHQDEVIPMLEHSWSNPEYVWADDNSSVTASRTCSTGNHTETETVNTASNVTKQATCEEKGETTYTATFTNAAFTAQSKTVADINALGHSWGEPTYTWSEDHSSVTAVRTCSRDGSHVETETVLATSEITKQPNCEEKGETTYTAVFTNPAFSTQTETIKNIEATGHTPAEAVKENETAATCTEDGGYDLVTYCSVCQKELSREHVTEKALGHNWSDWTVTKEPTCSEPGEKNRTCLRCNLEEKQAIDALDHALELVPGYEETCTEYGRKDYYQCSVCHNRYFDAEGKDPVGADEDLVIKSPGHNWSEWTITKEATCNEAGEKERICSRCNEKETETIEALGHTPGDEVKENNVDPTCTEEGGYDLVVYCTRCHEQLSSEHVTVPATGHVAGETVIENVHAPTCTSEGTHEEVIYCTACGTTLSRKLVSDPALGHDFGEWTITRQPSCTEAGIEERECSRCHEKETREVAALGHTPGEAVKENIVDATCTEKGSYDLVVKCTICNEIISTEHFEDAALGHDWNEPEYVWSEDNRTVTATRTCKRDKNHVESETAEVKTEIIEATCEEAEQIIYTVEFKNVIYKPQSKVVVNGEALGHDLVFDGFTWNSDYSSAEGRFVCTRDNNHVEIITAEIDSESFGAETDVTASIIGPDGKVYSETKKVVESDDVIRIYGPNRYHTSIKTARYLAEVKGTEKFDRMVITTGENFADALAGSYLANKYGAPVILMPSTYKPAYEDVVAYINDNISENGKVYVLGGTSAIPEERLSSVNRKIERIQGANRYITNINILKKAGYSGGEILVCTGNDFADSLSASAVNMPILLVKDQLTDEQKAYLKQFSDIRFTIIGGTSAVSSEVEKELAEYGTVVERIAGSNRFATSAEIAKKFFPEANQAVLAYGRTFPDGLAGGPLANALKAPLLLAESVDNNIAEATNYCVDRNISSGTVLGGPTLIKDGFVRKIFELDDNVIISEFE